jgi:hypothetical protein
MLIVLWHYYSYRGFEKEEEDSDLEETKNRHYDTVKKLYIFKNFCVLLKGMISMGLLWDIENFSFSRAFAFILHYFVTLPYFLIYYTLMP